MVGTEDIVNQAGSVLFKAGAATGDFGADMMEGAKTGLGILQAQQQLQIQQKTLQMQQEQHDAQKVEKGMSILSSMMDRKHPPQVRRALSDYYSQVAPKLGMPPISPENMKILQGDDDLATTIQPMLNEYSGADPGRKSEIKLRIFQLMGSDPDSLHTVAEMFKNQDDRDKALATGGQKFSLQEATSANKIINGAISDKGIFSKLKPETQKMLANPRGFMGSLLNQTDPNYAKAADAYNDVLAQTSSQASANQTLKNQSTQSTIDKNQSVTERNQQLNSQQFDNFLLSAAKAGGISSAIESKIADPGFKSAYMDPTNPGHADAVGTVSQILGSTSYQQNKWREAQIGQRQQRIDLFKQGLDLRSQSMVDKAQQEVANSVKGLDDIIGRGQRGDELFNKPNPTGKDLSELNIELNTLLTEVKTLPEGRRHATEIQSLITDITSSDRGFHLGYILGKDDSVVPSQIWQQVGDRYHRILGAIIDQRDQRVQNQINAKVGANTILSKQGVGQHLMDAFQMGAGHYTITGQKRAPVQGSRNVPPDTNMQADMETMNNLLNTTYKDNPAAQKTLKDAFMKKYPGAKI